MFTAALNIIVKTQKQPKCPPDEQIRCGCIYSIIKMNEFFPFTATWMDLEGIILSEVSQTEKIDTRGQQ